MKWALIAALLGVGGYAIWKHKSSPASTQQASLNSSVVTGNSEPAGVPLYSNMVAPNRVDQIAAFATSTLDSTVDGSYAPAFGATENQPDQFSTLL
jgi:hypothetical protein